MLCGNLEGWFGWEVGGRFEREGTYVYLWLIPVDVWQNPARCCKAIVLQLKRIKQIKKIKLLYVHNSFTGVYQRR